MDSLGQKNNICLATINDVNYDQRMQRIAHFLNNRGYDVHWIARKQFETNIYPFFHQIPVGCYFQKSIFFYAEYNIRLTLLLTRLPAFAFYYAVDLDTILPMWLIARIKGGKLVYDAHEYFSETPEVVRRPWVKRCWEWIAKWSIPKADVRITVGTMLANALSRRYGCPFHVVRNVPLKRKMPEQRKAKKYKLWYQGALNEGRGLEPIIEALSHLPDSFFLEIAGDGPLRESLETLVQKLNLQNRVHFHGMVQPAELPKLACDAFLGLNLLENSGLSYYYSLANKTFDMIQSGLPALHMNFPEYQQLNKELAIGWLAKDLNPAYLAALLQEIANQPSRWSEIQENCIKWAETLHWENEKRKLQDIF